MDWGKFTDVLQFCLSNTFLYFAMHQVSLSACCAHVTNSWGHAIMYSVFDREMYPTLQELQ